MLVAICPKCEKPDIVPADGGKYLDREPIVRFFCSRCDKWYTWAMLAAAYDCKVLEPCKEKDCECDK